MSLPVSFSYRALLSGVRRNQGVAVSYAGGDWTESVVPSPGGIYGRCDSPGVRGMGFEKMGEEAEVYVGIGISAVNWAVKNLALFWWGAELIP